MTAEGEAFKKKKDTEEPAYLIYRTTEILLLVFMHKASKKKKKAKLHQTRFLLLKCLYQAISPDTHIERDTRIKGDSNVKIRRQLQEKIFISLRGSCFYQ